VHGATGTPAIPRHPDHLGQQTNFLMKQLHDYTPATATTDHGAMAKTLKQEDLRPAAAYFGSKPWPAHAAAAPPPRRPPTWRLPGLPSAGLRRRSAGPRLAGQSYEYLIKQMNDFASGARTNSMDMGKIMSELSQADRETMAHYIAGL